MALQVCKTCSTRYAPAAKCPHCEAEEWVSELEADGQPAEPAPAPPAGGDDGPVDYESLPVAVLRELARDRGITQHGVLKADLVAALAAWDAEHPAGDGDGDGGQDDGAPAGDSISGD